MPAPKATRAARKAVARLIERYFKELKAELALAGDEFWKRIEPLFEPAPSSDPEKNASSVKRLDPL
jgi:hypothetical protein